MATFGALTRLFCATDSDHETDHDPPSTMSLALLAASGVACAVLAANAWRNRHYPGFAYFAAMELAAAFWIFCYLGEQLDPRPVARAALFESMPEVVLVLNEHDVVVDANRAACALLGHTERALLGLPWPQPFPAPEWHTIPHGSHNVLEREWVRDGTTTCLEVQRHPLWDAAGRSLGLLIVARDVTARKQVEQELREQSYRDRLTGLSNRRYLDDEAARLRPRGARGRRPVPGAAAGDGRRGGRAHPRAPHRGPGAVQHGAEPGVALPHRRERDRGSQRLGGRHEARRRAALRRQARGQRRSVIVPGMQMSITGRAAATAVLTWIMAGAPALAEAQRVRQVIDGDTITVSGVGVVRLLGVDAPEKTGGYRQSEPYGDAATKFMRALVEGQVVRLEYDGPRKDQYNRTLAYVFLADGRCANEAIIRAGFAETYRRFDYVKKPQFQAAEREAKDARRGMWANGAGRRRTQ